ncbi:hypothetical protein [Pseudosulfitobacter sp. SM2401]|jgi:hypothetical protein|uniref:hypothetical protein n=1 Tax=Pseudosulfitobacter sp. SM2401 TaxID=3350098 RepID=UPI0036F25129
MPILHDPENPRHARLFELLRQNDVVETMASRVHDFNIRKVNQDEMDVIKRVAARSMQRVN